MNRTTILLSNLLLLIILVGILIYGKSILSPVVFAVFFTLMLAPVCRWFEKRKIGSILAILFSFLLIIVPAVVLASFFSVQLVDIFRSLPSIRKDLENGLTQVLAWVQERFGVAPAESQEWLRQNVSSGFDSAIDFVGSGLSSSSIFLANVLLVVVYTFLMLYYRSAIKAFFIMQFKQSEQSKMKALIGKIQDVVKSYFFGLMLVILILGVLNTLGLWLIGIKYAPLWGSLAALLAIIPYIGTTLGGTLPFLYALVTTGTFWQPAAVVILYMSIQQIEGNFITPNVVGSSIKINPLVVIFSMILGGFIWGIAGLIIALPMVAIIRVLLLENSHWRPVGLLLDNNIRKNVDKFQNELNHESHRLRNFFKKKDK